MSKPSKVARALRVGALIIGAMAVTSVVGAASLLPLPEHRMTAPAATVQPTAAQLTSACAGPFLALSEDADDTGAVTAISGVEALAATETGEAESEALAQPAGDPAPTIYRADADAVGELAAVQSQVLEGADVTGLTAATCVEPASSRWLLGGSTTTGRDTLLVVANPTEVDAALTIDLVTEVGPVSAAGMNGIVLAPGEQRALSLAAFAPGSTALAVHVASRGGRVTAVLQHSATEVLDPVGADVVAPTAAPATTQYLPGLRLPESAGLDFDGPVATGGEQQAVVRVYVPGGDAADLAVRAVPRGGEGGEPLAEARVEPGQLADIPLGGFAPGAYDLVVESSVPVITAARFGSSGETTDFAWASAATPLTTPTLAQVAAAPSPLLHLVNPSDQEVTVGLELGDDTREVTIGAGLAEVIEVDARSRVRLDPSGAVYAAISYSGNLGVATTTVAPPAPAASALTIRP